jgi:hypothetical protein
MHLARLPNALTYGFATADGRRIARHFEARNDWPLATWQRLPPPGGSPWAFQDPPKPFRWRDAPEIDAFVIQLRQNADLPSVKLGDFLRQAEQERVRRNRSNIVLDMRFNSGGDLLLDRDFLAQWPSKFMRGRFYVLTSDQTFSAGIASVAYLKQAGGKRVTLVGEPPGDRLTFFAEGHAVELPNSKIVVMPATARHDYHDGCRKFSDCFAAVAQPKGPTGSPIEIAAHLERIPISVATLNPDIPAPLTIKDLAAGRDPAIEAVTRAIRHRHQ